MRRVSCNSDGITLTLKSFQNGGVIIFPTDTIYGIGCNPYDENAIDKIYRIKKRDRTKLLPILGYSKQILEEIAYFGDLANKIAKKFWPGPLTLVLPLKDKKLLKLFHGANTIAVRVPNNKCALTLLKECKLIIGTSANISGEKSLTNPENYDEIIDGCDIFLNGGIMKNPRESTIIEIDNMNIRFLRLGAIPKEDFDDIF